MDTDSADVAAMVLTGGTSRRMGRDKATLPAGTTTLAGQTAALVVAVARLSVEIGPGHTGLPAILDTVTGGGPLAAVATGATWLAHHGWDGPSLVVATDLPLLNADLLAWLVQHPASGSVVPLDAGGRPQPLCARYHRRELAAAETLVAAGHRAMHRLLAGAPDVTYVPFATWAEVGGGDALIDVDTPADLAALVSRHLP